MKGNLTVTSKQFIENLPKIGKARLLTLGQLALIAMPLMTLASPTPYPSAVEHTGPVISQRPDATRAQMDPPWTWAEKYYFTS